MVIGGCRMWLGFDPEADGWALREITSLCGLTLGEGVEEDLAGPEPRPACVEPVRDRQHLKLVSHGSPR